MKNKKDIIFGDTNIREIDSIAMPEHLFNEEKNYFSFVATGNGMINAGIKDNDIVIFEITDEIKNGEIGCFTINGKPICKRYFYNQEHSLHVLQYEDSKQAPILVNDNQEFKILGKLFMILNREIY